jgi:hypothetical protein
LFLIFHLAFRSLDGIPFREYLSSFVAETLVLEITASSILPARR